MSSTLYPDISERWLLVLVGAVQFVNILDFMMVLPLGPDFAHALNISEVDLGWIGGSYTAAAAVAGILGSLFIDKLDRKVALLWAVAGLIATTTFGGFTWNFNSLLLSRVLAGLCGGPATSIAWSIVADVVEPARRGQAMGKVMGAFSLAAVFGVPFGLELAVSGTWSTPFFVTGALGAVAAACIVKYMPAMRAHLGKVHQAVSLNYLLKLLAKLNYALVYLYIALAMLASFMIIPNISAFVQYNLHYPREHLWWLYCAGGGVSFITMRITGIMIDRFRASTTSFLSAGTFICVLMIMFIYPVQGIPVVVFFMLFMFAMGMRNVSSTTLATTLPPPEERAGFMSLLSCVQSAAMSVGAFMSTRLLTENADHSLNGMRDIAVASCALSILVPVLMRMVEHRLKRPQ